MEQISDHSRRINAFIAECEDLARQYKESEHGTALTPAAVLDEVQRQAQTQGLPEDIVLEMVAGGLGVVYRECHTAWPMDFGVAISPVDRDSPAELCKYDFDIAVVALLAAVQLAELDPALLLAAIERTAQEYAAARSDSGVTLEELRAEGTERLLIRYPELARPPATEGIAESARPENYDQARAALLTELEDRLKAMPDSPSNDVWNALFDWCREQSYQLKDQYSLSTQQADELKQATLAMMDNYYEKLDKKRERALHDLPEDLRTRLMRCRSRKQLESEIRFEIRRATNLLADVLNGLKDEPSHLLLLLMTIVCLLALPVLYGMHHRLSQYEQSLAQAVVLIEDLQHDRRAEATRNADLEATIAAYRTAAAAPTATELSTPPPTADATTEVRTTETPAGLVKDSAMITFKSADEINGAILGCVTPSESSCGDVDALPGSQTELTGYIADENGVILWVQAGIIYWRAENVASIYWGDPDRPRPVQLPASSGSTSTPATETQRSCRASLKDLNLSPLINVEGYIIISGAKPFIYKSLDCSPEDSIPIEEYEALMVGDTIPVTGYHTDRSGGTWWRTAQGYYIESEGINGSITDQRKMNFPQDSLVIDLPSDSRNTRIAPDSTAPFRNRAWYADSIAYATARSEDGRWVFIGQRTWAIHPEGTNDEMGWLPIEELLPAEQAFAATLPVKDPDSFANYFDSVSDQLTPSPGVVTIGNEINSFYLVHDDLVGFTAIIPAGSTFNVVGYLERGTDPPIRYYSDRWGYLVKLRDGDTFTPASSNPTPTATPTPTPSSPANQVPARPTIRPTQPPIQRPQVRQSPTASPTPRSVPVSGPRRTPTPTPGPNSYRPEEPNYVLVYDPTGRLIMQNGYDPVPDAPDSVASAAPRLLGQEQIRPPRNPFAGRPAREPRTPGKPFYTGGGKGYA